MIPTSHNKALGDIKMDVQRRAKVFLIQILWNLFKNYFDLKTACFFLFIFIYYHMTPK